MPVGGPSCSTCGYDLRSLVGAGGIVTCPECGGVCDRYSRYESPRRTCAWLLSLGCLPTTATLGMLAGLFGAVAMGGWLVYLLGLLPLLAVAFLAGVVWPLPAAAYVLRDERDREVLVAGLLLIGCNVLQFAAVAALVL